MKRVEVYLDANGACRRLGVLEYGELRGKEVSSFELDHDYVVNPSVGFLGPDIGLFRGKQYPVLSGGFGIFQDSAPDSWGKKLIRRREKRGNLRESDYLLGVFDLTRVGALRFRLEGADAFVNADAGNPAPPWTTLRTLEDSSRRFEVDDTDEEALSVLLQPGSSLGGARPKASVTAPDGSLWLAKFPSRDDECDTGAWEYLVHLLAVDAGLNVPDARAQKFSRQGTTFLCRRFDREGSRRIPFASAMTMLGCEDRQEENNGTYLDIAGFLLQHGAAPERDLPELWRRIAFSFLVSNTDDHLRNHAFLFTSNGWRLSPLYDVNPVSYGDELSLNVDDGDNRISIDLALRTAPRFGISEKKARYLADEILADVRENWTRFAEKYCISRANIAAMKPAFLS